jgi:copper chaperone CopZ
MLLAGQGFYMAMQYYIHYTQGRIRIQTPVLQDNPSHAAEFEEVIGKIPGIISVEVNPVTGSALLYFDEKIINCEQIIGLLEKNDYFVLRSAETNEQFIEKTAEKILEVAEKIITGSLDEGMTGE